MIKSCLECDTMFNLSNKTKKCITFAFADFIEDNNLEYQVAFKLSNCFITGKVVSLPEELPPVMPCFYARLNLEKIVADELNRLKDEFPKEYINILDEFSFIVINKAKIIQQDNTILEFPSYILFLDQVCGIFMIDSILELYSRKSLDSNS